MKLFFIVFLVIKILIFMPLFCITIGDPLSTYFQKHYNLKSINNIINPSAIMHKGFSLRDINTTCSYASVYYANNYVNLHEGRLFLNEDFILQKDLQITNPGKIYGNNYNIKFPSLTSPLDLPLFTKGIMKLCCDPQDIGSGISSSNWSYDDKYIAFGENNNIKIFYFNDNTITSTKTTIFSNRINSIDWHPSNHYLAIATTNNLEIYKLNIYNGTFTQVDTTATGINIKSISWNPSGSFLATLRGSSDITIYPFNGTTLGSATTTALSEQPLNRGSLISWRGDGYYLTTCYRYKYAPQNYRGKVLIYSFNGSTLIHNHTRSTPAEKMSLDWSLTNSFIAAGSSNDCHISLYEHNSTNSTLTKYDQISLSTIPFDIHWNYDGNYLGMANEGPNESEFKSYYLNITTTEFRNLSVYNISPSVNGKTFRWSHNNEYISTGDANGKIRIFHMGSSPFLFNNINMEFNSDVNFKKDSLFKGTCSISGNNHSIIFDNNFSTTAIKVLADSTLTLKNTKLYFQNHPFISLENSSSKLKLENIFLDILNGIELSSNPIEVYGKSDFSGTYSFPMIFQNKSHSSLFKDTTLSSTWLFKGTTFLNGNGTVLNLHSTGSIIVNHNATLYLSNITLKGVRDGLLRLMNDSSTIYMSDVAIEFDYNTTFTVGGIYIQGPTTFILKDHDLTFEQNASLTVDGITLWKDYLDKTTDLGDIKFGSGAIENYLSLIESGTIKYVGSVLCSIIDHCLNPLRDNIQENSNAIINNSNSIYTNEQNINYNSQAITINAQNIIYNSNTIVNLEKDINENSQAIVTNAQNITYNSRAIIDLQKFVIENSSAIVTNRSDIDSNDTDIAALQADVAENSSAIVNLQTDVTENSSAIVNTNDFSVQNSYAIVDHHRHFISLNDGKLYTVGSITGEASIDGRAILSSTINLNGATLTNYGDILFSSQTTIESSGYLNPQGHAYIFGSNLNIPENVTLTFTSNGIMDGQGYNLIFGNNAQILIDSNVTLTLKNLTINNSLNTITNPPIKCLSSSSKLILDDVKFALDDDFAFNAGQLYIHNDVMFTGTSQFTYRSVAQSYIQPHSTLYFDYNTVFDYSPSSTKNDLIALADRTASIYLNGCTLQTTDTGIKLTKGQLFCDNKVTFISGPNDPTFYNSIIFGNSSKGSDYNLNIYVFGGAQVKVDGLIWLDNLN